MASLPFGIHFGAIEQTQVPRFSLSKLIVFCGAVLIGLAFWATLGWLALKVIH